MKNYSKPIVLMNEELAEGIYAASGDGDCWEVSAYIHQWPQTGRWDYRIQTTGTHLNPDNHLSSITITYHFSDTITSASFSSGESCTYSGSTVTITVNKNTNNSNEGLGLGELTVTSPSDTLVLNGVSWVCNGK